MKKLGFVLAPVAAVIVAVIFFYGCSKVAPLAASSVPAAVAAPIYPLSVVIDDCDDNDNVDKWGGYWFTYDDTKSPNFGKSLVYPRNGALFTMVPVGPDWDTLKNGPNAYAAEIYGLVIRGANPGNGGASDIPTPTKPYPPYDFPYPFIGCGVGLNSANNPQNLTNFSGLRFWCKRGATDTIGTYRVSFQSSNVTNTAKQDYYGFTFAVPPPDPVNPKNNWHLVDVRFNTLKAEPPGVITGLISQQAWTWPLDKTTCMSLVQALQFQTKKADPSYSLVEVDEPVDFWMDNIVLYRD
jgi:hypothetical protein